MAKASSNFSPQALKDSRVRDKKAAARAGISTYGSGGFTFGDEDTIFYSKPIATKLTYINSDGKERPVSVVGSRALGRSILPMFTRLTIDGEEEEVFERLGMQSNHYIDSETGERITDEDFLREHSELPRVIRIKQSDIPVSFESTEGYTTIGGRKIGGVNEYLTAWAKMMQDSDKMIELEHKPLFNDDREHQMDREWQEYLLGKNGEGLWKSLGAGKDLSEEYERADNFGAMTNKHFSEKERAEHQKQFDNYHSKEEREEYQKQFDNYHSKKDRDKFKEQLGDKWNDEADRASHKEYVEKLKKELASKGKKYYTKEERDAYHANRQARIEARKARKAEAKAAKESEKYDASKGDVTGDDVVTDDDKKIKTKSGNYTLTKDAFRTKTSLPKSSVVYEKQEKPKKPKLTWEEKLAKKFMRGDDSAVFIKPPTDKQSDVNVKNVYKDVSDKVHEKVLSDFRMKNIIAAVNRRF